MATLGDKAFCPKCKCETLLSRKPKYDGFKKIGETASCLLCGHVFEAGAKAKHHAPKKPALFKGEDKPVTPKIFKGDENARMCRYCAEYVVNPFTQRCNIHQRDVQATDTCDRFTPKPPPKTAQSDQEKPDPPTLPQ